MLCDVPISSTLQLPCSPRRGAGDRAQVCSACCAGVRKIVCTSPRSHLAGGSLSSYNPSAVEAETPDPLGSLPCGVGKLVNHRPTGNPPLKIQVRTPEE